MSAFRLSPSELDTAALRQELSDPSCGGLVFFEGRVRDHNEGRAVTGLEYEAFAPLAIKEGERILREALERFGVVRALCAHRVGALEVGGIAVFIGIAAGHRGEAFAACRYVIDEVKVRVPIWKKEHYADGPSDWVNCPHCASAAAPGSLSRHAHERHEH